MSTDIEIRKMQTVFCNSLANTTKRMILPLYYHLFNGKSMNENFVIQHAYNKNLIIFTIRRSNKIGSKEWHGNLGAGINITWIF